VIGLVFTGFFALGLVLVSKYASNIDLTLFSSAMCWESVLWTPDIQQTVLFGDQRVVAGGADWCFRPRT